MFNKNKAIVHVIEATATGTLSMAAMLANSQAKRGYDVHVIYSRRLETPSDVEGFFNQGISLVNIKMLGLKAQLLSFFEIREYLNNVMPDAVFMHSSIAGFIGRISTIWLPYKVYYIPHCISFMRMDINLPKKTLFILLECIAAAKKSTYIACSRSEREAIMKFLPFCECLIVENAVDFKRPPEKEPGLGGKKTVVTVGQIRTQKDPLRYIEIMEAVKKRDPEVDFIWIGDGDEELKDRLKSSGVFVMGWLSKEKVWEFLFQASVYLSTSKWEGMPVSLIEACYARLPIVASECSGNVDVVDHGRTGFIYNNIEEAGRYISNALAKDGFSERQVELAFLEARERFSSDRYVDEINRLF
ncbi:glycosyltransferase [Halomonas salinarum]|uniref:glycosyltransferase n=1 Tax=Halomonas salinarum TaxID=1158993 RepID=UPI00143C095D|nr:glycosyltransferase [Halomonas salinarum]